MKVSAKNVDMLNGSISKGLIEYAVPVMLASLLQMLYNTADLIVVGRFAETVEIGSRYLAAVGAGTAIINLMRSFYGGVAMGAGVRAARLLGAGDKKRASETAHTAFLLSLIFGIIIAAVGLAATKGLLRITECPEDILEDAALYMRIYFLGIPAACFYNFAACLARADGDTRTPLYILTGAGILNVILNMIAVIVFRLGIAGVAIATTASQIFSAVSMIVYFRREKNPMRISLDKLRMKKEPFLDILRIGLPACISGVLFNVSKTFIQAAVNTFPTEYIAGSTAASNLTNYLYTGIEGMLQACMTFASQNLGARKPDRIRQILRTGFKLVTIYNLTASALMVLFRQPLLALYNTDPAVIACGEIRVFVVGIPYFVLGFMEVATGVNRGLGHSADVSLISLICGGGFRVLYVLTLFRWYHDFSLLMASFPISWAITALAQYLLYRKIVKKETAKLMPVQGA